MNHCAGLLFITAIAMTTYAGFAWSQPSEPVESLTAASDASDADSFAMEERLSQVAYRMLVDNAELCGNDTTRLLGLAARPSGPVYQYDSVPGPSEHLTISWVIPDAPAAKDGLREGDQILEIDGELLPLGREGLHQFRDRLLARSDDILNLEIERAGARRQVAVKPVSGCDYEIGLSESEEVNAFAEERHVFVTEGMLTFLRVDDQLAIVVGHELGHIMAGHTEGVMDAEMGVAAEAEADYLGVYLAARAGYDVSGTADVLRRIVTVHHGGPAGTHSATDIEQRLQAIEMAVGEVKTKRVLGESLYPSAERLLRSDGKHRPPMDIGEGAPPMWHEPTNPN